ncbi:MAG: hypothetical protein UY50_C0008G0032 [Parcubacteria group bacterium GW2011_GWA2_49_9]|nr:MAG: hypothetical protein UY50_C0008G0032 [Parcubacteria group bacterium GW2011_GWA2_49_9]
MPRKSRTTMLTMLKRRTAPISKELQQRIAKKIEEVFTDIPMMTELNDRTRRDLAPVRRAFAAALTEASRIRLAKGEMRFSQRSIADASGFSTVTALRAALARAKSLVGEEAVKLKAVLYAVDAVAGDETPTQTQPPPEEEAVAILIRVQEAVHSVFLPDAELFSGACTFSAELARQALAFVLVSDYKHEPNMVGPQVGMNRTETYVALGTIWHLDMSDGETHNKLEAVRQILSVCG